MNTEYDVVVIGSGVAGLSVALGLAGSRRVAVVTGGALESGSTAWAQGGLAAAIGPGDDVRNHSADTEVAGVGVCDPDAVRTLTDGAPASVADLVRAGAKLDHSADGELALTREGGHHHRRVVHAGGDATGAEVSRALAAAIRDALVTVIENAVVDDLLIAHDALGVQVAGVRVRHAEATIEQISARAVVLATGGVGGLYVTSTNPAEVSAAGLGLALRAGASLTDLEFVQFHPTALRLPAGLGQIPLITEALRGEGAVLRDARGRPVMAGHHPLADLAPRDIVARRIDEVIAQGDDVGLDATALGTNVLRGRFPTVYAACRQHGIDPAREPIPVAPAQHFLCGGVRTDSWGSTDVVGLYAVGEVAATGVHGANRLASNSLIEAMVFGRRLASRLVLGLPPVARGAAEVTVPAPTVPASAIPEIRAMMTVHAGIRRSAAGLEAADDELEHMVRASGAPSTDAGNRWLAASAIVTAAAARRESRGCHWRRDYPATQDSWRRHLTVRLGADGRPAIDTIDRRRLSA
jgi:L-aspartate oxidase